MSTYYKYVPLSRGIKHLIFLLTYLTLPHCTKAT